MEEKELKEQNANKFPVIVLRGHVAFPGTTMHFDIGRNFSLKAVRQAIKSKDKRVILVAQKDFYEDEPSVDQIYEVGVVAVVRQILQHSKDFMRVLVSTEKTVSVKNLEYERGCIFASTQPYNLNHAPKDPNQTDAIIRLVKSSFEKYAKLLPNFSQEILYRILFEENIDNLFVLVASNLDISFKNKQNLLEEKGYLLRFQILYAILIKEIEVLQIENDVKQETMNMIEKRQKDAYLREQLDVIRKQLGDSDDDGELVRFHIRVSEMPEEAKEKLLKECDKAYSPNAHPNDKSLTQEHIETVLSLPWGSKNKLQKDITKASAVLEKDHYGMEKVKKRVLESIAVQMMTPNANGNILCLVGAPGVGKTSIGKSLAKATGRQYVRVSLGGIHDESDIRGHRKTYLGAMPGKIIRAIQEAKSANALVLLDEIDKLGQSSHNGDPSAALLEVLDPEQNCNFKDNYIEVPFDLSDVMFVATANTLDTIDKPLLDRMEVIELGSYTRQEKLEIAKNHLFAKQLKKHGLKKSQLKITDEAFYLIIDFYTREAGVRNLEREIASLCRKAAKEIVSGNIKSLKVTEKNLEALLGVKKYHPDYENHQDEVGLVNGLAWTSVGGVLMPLEVATFSGKGDLQLTGSLGDVMKESARIAVSVARSKAKTYAYSEGFHKEMDLHIHAPEGAVPKDGPSAGVTMTTALVSALSNIPVRSDVAMTGEITLHGKVLPIGGLREKSMAAYKSGMKKVIVPKGNYADAMELDHFLRDEMDFVFAETIDDVLQHALKQ